MHYNVVEGYLLAAESAGELLASPAVAARWDQSSALPHWSVSSLSGHLTRAVFTVQSSLVSLVDSGPTAMDAIAYYASSPVENLNPGSEIARRIRERGDEAAGAGLMDLLARYRNGLADVRALLAGTPETRSVSVFGKTLALREWLRTRTVEIVVHCDDLCVSVGCPPVVFPQPVVDDVIGILAAVASRRHGPQALLRALARSERATDSIAAF